MMLLLFVFIACYSIQEAQVELRLGLEQRNADVSRLHEELTKIKVISTQTKRLAKA